MTNLHPLTLTSIIAALVTTLTTLVYLGIVADALIGVIEMV